MMDMDSYTKGLIKYKVPCPGFYICYLIFKNIHEVMDTLSST